MADRHEVLIAGAGPTGMTLAAELALAGVDAAIVERRPDRVLAGSRAGGLHARTIEVFEQRGIADRFLAEGQVAQVAGFAGIRLDIGDFPTRHPYGLGLWQNHIERILAGWVDELGVPVLLGREVTGVAQDDAGVEVELADGGTLRAGWLVGCDGGRSAVRKSVGIDFPGHDATVSHIIAEVEVGEEPEWGTRRDRLGMHGLSRVEYEIVDGEIVWADHGPVRVMVTEAEVDREAGDPTLEDLSAALVAVYGTDYGIHSPTWVSRFTDAARQASSYREGRVLLAGDAAHVHYPAGGQGLNIGVQDAVNLGWKLALVARGLASDALLDSYQAERHPVAARVLRDTLAQVALLRTDDRTNALREWTTELLAMEEPRKRIAGVMSGLELRYDLGEGHPLVGRRMPDLELETAQGTVRVFELLREARPVLLNLGPGGGLDLSQWSERVRAWGGRVRMVDAAYGGRWELPVVGDVPAPAAVLIRPDGYVAWAGDGERDGLEPALERWCGGRPSG